MKFAGKTVYLFPAIMMTDMKKRIFVTLLSAVLAVSAQAQTQTIRAFSHRGGRMERDENTMLAFQESWDLGYTGFETDVRMTADGELFILHDATLERTTDGNGTIEKMTADEIRGLHTKKGNKVLSFEELCRFFDGKDNLYVEWELKTNPTALYPQDRLEEMVEKVYQGVKSIRTRNSQMVFTSGDYRGLRYLQTHHPDADLLLIIGRPLSDETIAIAKTTGIYTLGCTMEGTSRRDVAKAHEAGITVSLWPGKSVEDFVLGAYLGCDRMCTDVPAAVKKYVTENLPWLNVIY